MAKPELWRVVPSMPDILVSTRGRFMIVPKVGDMPYGGKRHYSGRARIGIWDPKHKRYSVKLSGKHYKVARLVCEAFHGSPPFEGAVCMHLDENGKNNRPENLKWGTQKENLNAPGFIAYCQTRVGENSPTVKGKKAKAA